LWMVVEIVKFMVNRSRPFIRLTQARVLGLRAIGRSFPSGHTSQAFFMATLIIQHYHINILAASVLYILAVMVGITRMYVGAHYPRDVLAGAILGSVWGFLGVIVEGYYL
jgi:membrane-associated phospholipid phosphatase